MKAWRKIKRVRERLRKRSHHDCRFLLEGIAENGHVVEVCRVCGKRKVYVVHRDEQVSLMVLDQKGWEERGGKILSKGVRRVRQESNGAGEKGGESPGGQATARLRELALRQTRRDSEID